MKNRNEVYEVAIVGGGVTGTALLYILSQYTNIRNIVLLEKYEKIAEVNSQTDNNSQTLHFGDIETNYTRPKAERVKEAAEMTAHYVEAHGPGLFKKFQKMVLAVGEEEGQVLERRFAEFQDLFPGLRKIGRDEIARLEPKVVAGRDPHEKIIALYSEDGYAIDYQKLSESFVENALKTDKRIDVFLRTNVGKIEKVESSFLIRTGQTSLRAAVVVVAAGAHSLIFARSLGYGKEYGILPVAGSFYCADNALKGKVYTLQMEKLPFAAVHGDPDVNNPDETRFGPTAKVLPLLERHNYKTIPDFLRTSSFTLDGVLSLLVILFDKVIFRYVLKNILYDLPLIGKWAFLREVRKIVPSLRFRDLHPGRGIGGIRPQVVNIRTKKLEMGEGKIIGDHIIFNITPSPGASVALKNAENDARTIIQFLGTGYTFDESQLTKEYGQ